MVKRIKIKIYGKVQGVAFRYYTAREAERLEIAGWVRNMDDGSVAAEGEGEEAGLVEFLRWCRHGPRQAKVTNFEFEFRAKLKLYSGFEIRG